MLHSCSLLSSSQAILHTHSWMSCSLLSLSSCGKPPPITVCLIIPDHQITLLIPSDGGGRVNYIDSLTSVDLDQPSNGPMLGLLTKRALSLFFYCLFFIFIYFWAFGPCYTITPISPSAPIAMRLIFVFFYFFFFIIIFIFIIL